MIKRILIFLTILLFFQSAFSATRTFTQTDNKQFILDVFDSYGSNPGNQKQKITSLNQKDLQCSFPSSCLGMHT